MAAFPPPPSDSDSDSDDEPLVAPSLFTNFFYSKLRETESPWWSHWDNATVLDSKLLVVYIIPALKIEVPVKPTQKSSVPVSRLLNFNVHCAVIKNQYNFCFFYF